MPDSMPIANDRDETQQSEVPPEEWVHTPFMKEALSKGNPNSKARLKYI